MRELSPNPHRSSDIPTLFLFLGDLITYFFSALNCLNLNSLKMPRFQCPSKIVLYSIMQLRNIETLKTKQTKEDKKPFR